MRGSVFLCLLLLVPVFWAVGVRTRLMRLRSRACSAFAVLEARLLTLSQLVQTHLRGQNTSALPDLPSTSTNGISTSSATTNGTSFTHLTSTHEVQQLWAMLGSHASHVETALAAAHDNPLAVAPLVALGQALQTLQAQWYSLCSVPVDLAGSPIPEALHEQWQVGMARVETARSAFNQILQDYNAARREFPARLLVRWLHFEATGTL